VIVAKVDGDWDWDDDWVERSQPVEDISQVEFDARGTLYIVQGRRSTLKLEGHEDALDQLHIEQRAGTLVISQKGDEFRWFTFVGKSRNPVYTLEIAELNAITHSGHGDVKVGPFNSETLRVDSAGHAQTYLAAIIAQNVIVAASGHSHVRIETLDSHAMSLAADAHANVYVQDANVMDAQVRAQSHGEVWLAGRGDSIDIKVRDHSDLEANAFDTSVANIVASDHASAQLQVSDEIQLDQRDQASVSITGDPNISTAGE
jgi:hypothetical protein